MKSLALGLLMALVSLGASCPGYSDDPAVSRIQTATVTCATIASSINILATMRIGGQLSSGDIKTVEALILVVQPICGVAHTSGDLIDLDGLEDYLWELQKVSGGSS